VELSFQGSRIGGAGREYLREIIEKNPKNSLNFTGKVRFRAHFPVVGGVGDSAFGRPDNLDRR